MNDNITIKNNIKSRRGLLQALTKRIGSSALLVSAVNLIASKEIKAAITPNPLPAVGTEEFIGSIDRIAINDAPRNWEFCKGQLLSIQSNAALFSLLGTTYGGNGQTTFALPDLKRQTPNTCRQWTWITFISIGRKRRRGNARTKFS